MPRVGRHVLPLAAQVLGGVWTLPNTLLGLLAGAVGLLRGARCSAGEGALVFLDYPWGPGGAMTLGQTILVRGSGLDARCRPYADRLSPAGAARAVGGEAVAGREGSAPCRTASHPDGSPEDVRWLRLGDHERAHVYQYLLFGPLFLPLYAICGGISARNPFERAADRYALGRGGWWPWGPA